ncbi:unnamed protein product [Rotaria sordida]|uniref:Tumor necrosis factor alpha-induced protein 8-like protein n=1 Tax=Rotaria sordida TaxID=392033 RepID=A0A815FA93_9BILA|nr:unnamed protein product [Rotaria sordida]CAF1323384.1 unnamed protein product [Rotaria sordida]
MSSKTNNKEESSQTTSVSQQLARQLEAAAESDEEEISVNASALSLGIRAQKKLLSKLSSKSVAKIFIDETSGRILDNLHKLARNYSEHELKLIDEFRNRFHSLAKSIITLYEVDFKFDRSVLTRMCQECQELTHKIISKHLTQKSHTRIDYVFNYVSNIEFLEYSFNPNSTINRAIIKEIIADMHTLMDSGFL